MADDLRFPILFDLEKGVEQAIKDWDGKYADKLEKAIQKRALDVKLKFDTNAFDNLDDVKRRLAELKITPLTPENKKAIQELTKELKGLAQLMEKISKFKGIELPELQMAKAAKLRKDVEQANEKLRLSQERVRQAEERLILSQQRAAQQANRTTKAYSDQGGYLERLIKKMAIYASFSMVSNFLTSVREVTAQFELQRVSLGAILQDATKGEQIFSQIKQFALSSPLSILDLTKYTKQLAAYKIEYNELFDLTKRLADISVGLGTDFQRIVLAVGQVRTATYLRASELKQFTELGVPLLEELSIKLSKMNGDMVTTAEVMDMISKRAISWELVKDVLYDMTDAGGMFYNMQVQQGNTLYGLWQKLGDAASVMYEQIGNTGWVNSGMKEAIQLLTELMRNWKAVGLTVATSVLPAVAAMAAWKMATKALAKSVSTATNERIVAEAKLATAMKGTDIAAQNAARSTLAKAKADEAAAIAAQKNATWQNKLKTGFVSLGKSLMTGLGIGLVITLVTQLIYKFYEALTNFRKLKRELDSIYTETATLQDQSVRNFEFLADKAVHAAAGSKEQTDALQELNRTYRDILPQESLTIENLTKMKGKYDALTQSIREYIAEQQKQKAESAIMEYYGTQIRDTQGEVRERLLSQGVSATEIGRFFAEFEKIAPEAGRKVSDKFHDAMLKAGIKDEKRIAKIWDKVFAVKRSDTYTFTEGYLAISGLSTAYANQANELKGMNEQYRESIGNLGKFADMQKRVSDTVANATYKDVGGKPIDPEKRGDLLDALKLNLWVKQTAAEIQKNEDIKKAFAYMGEGIKSEWFSIINAIDSNDLGKVSQINFDAIIASVDSMIAELGNKNPEILNILNTFRNYLVAQKKEYENMVPSKAVVVRWQTTWRQIVKELKISGQNMNQYLMGSAEDFETYRKRIKDEVAKVIKTIALLQDAITKNKKTGKRTKEQQAQDEKELKQAQERKVALEKLLAELDKIDIETGKNKKGPKGSKSDTRLQVLQEVAQTLATINREYEDLAKKEGASKALADIKERFKDVLAYANKLGGKFGLNFGFPTEFKTLQEYRNAILEVMKSLKGLPKGSEKTILDFKTMIGKADSDYLQKQIEAQIKELADKISRTKTAKEFYDKVLGMTGDYELAAKVSVSIYGDTGYDLQKQLAQQVRQYFQNDQVSIEIPVDVITDDNQINYKKLGEFAEKMKKELGEGPYKAIKKIAEEGQKDLAKTYEGYLKDLEKAQTYADKRIELARTTAEKIRKINADIAAGNIDEKVGKETIRGLQDKESIEAAKREYEAFKDTPLYVQMFEDLEHASTSTLEMMKRRLERLKGVWGTALDPTQLKDIQSRMNEIDEQLRTRNPFKTLKESYQQYRDAVKSVSLRGAVENAGAAAKELYDRTVDYGADSAQARDAQRELIAREKIVKIARQITAENKKGQKALDAAAQIANDNLKIARGHLDIASEEEKKAVAKAEKEGEDPAKDPGVLAAREKVEAAKEEVRLAERVAEITTNYAHEAKTWKESLSAAAETTFVYLNAASDLAHSIADLTEEFGGSEEDVQYWNDIGDALGNITAGAQDLIKNILDFNVAGMVSSIVTALPKMAIGFSQLFSAGKVKRANKEIKRQQKLLEQLEYTYGRLEAAADKAFGRDYLNNYNQQLKNLQAQQAAYEKQVRAERSKGKKKDEEKIKEYENQARETADKIKELQDDLVAHFTGSSRTDVARQMAKSWIDARASMSDTFAAIKGDYADMIKNMIVEGAAARVIENALTPVWDSMEKMLAKNDVQGAIDSLVNGMDSALNAANNGMEVLWKALEARGYDMKKLIGDTDSEYTGIAKSVAGATSEEILQLSGFVNTALYHTAYLPKIYEELVAMRTASLPTATVSTTSAGWTDWQQQAMDNYMAIQRNTADTVVECRRAANACEKMMKVIKTKGATSGFNVFLNA